MASLVRAVALLAFMSSMCITGGLMVYGKDWSEQRVQALREARSLSNGIAIGAFFCTLLLPAKRRRRTPVRERGET
jgi:hypothetical protein